MAIGQVAGLPAGRQVRSQYRPPFFAPAKNALRSSRRRGAAMAEHG